MNTALDAELPTPQVPTASRQFSSHESHWPPPTKKTGPFLRTARF